MAKDALAIRPLSPKRWGDFEALVGPRGACGGCWCMTPRLPRAVYEKQKGEGNKRALQAIVKKGPPPGVLGYLGGRAIAWCSLEPRPRFPWLANSRVLAPVDDEPVWSIVCLYVAKEHRGAGVSAAMVAGAVRWAKTQGARLVEAYPIAPKDPKKPVPAAFAWTGLLAAYERAGFTEVARRSPTRPIVRLKVAP